MCVCVRDEHIQAGANTKATRTMEESVSVVHYVRRQNGIIISSLVTIKLFPNFRYTMANSVNMFHSELADKG